MTHHANCQKTATQADEAMDEVTSLLEASTDYSLIGLDPAGHIQLWNRGAAVIYGHAPASIIGKASIELLHTPEDVARGTHREILATAARDGGWAGTITQVRQNGERFSARAVITPRVSQAGRLLGFLTISRDLSEEILLTDLHGAITDQAQLRRRYEALAEQYRRVQAANQMKSEFLTSLSHELRTPLNGIIGLAELMHDGTGGPATESHKEFLGDILASAHHLLRLLNDVLDLAKVEAGKLSFSPEPLDIATVVGEVRDSLRTVAAQKGVAVVTELEPGLKPIVNDPPRLKQVLYNYLSNALKFTPEGGSVTLRVSAEGQDAVRLAVADTGIGIRPEDLGRLFLAFQQLDGGAGKMYQGTGVGLALTKRIVEAQGGTVGVESTVGRGSCFFAVMPRVLLPAPREGGPA